MDAETIREFFSAFGRIDIRRMFGGMGLYADGVMFGVVAFDAVFLRADEATVPDFEAESCSPFSYPTKRGTIESRWLWKIPDRLLDEPEELALWARKAVGAAHRRATAKAQEGDGKQKRKPAGKTTTAKPAVRQVARPPVAKKSAKASTTKAAPKNVANRNAANAPSPKRATKKARRKAGR